MILEAGALPTPMTGELNSVSLVSWRRPHTKMLSTHHTHSHESTQLIPLSSLEPPFQISRGHFGPDRNRAAKTRHT